MKVVKILLLLAVGMVLAAGFSYAYDDDEAAGEVSAVSQSAAKVIEIPGTLIDEVLTRNAVLAKKAMAQAEVRQAGAVEVGTLARSSNQEALLAPVTK